MMRRGSHVCWVDDTTCAACGSAWRATERGRMVAALLFVSLFIVVLAIAGAIEGVK